MIYFYRLFTCLSVILLRDYKGGGPGLVGVGSGVNVFASTSGGTLGFKSRKSATDANFSSLFFRWKSFASCGKIQRIH